jgi:hypothetical protein
LDALFDHSRPVQLDARDQTMMRSRRSPVNIDHRQYEQLATILGGALRSDPGMASRHLAFGAWVTGRQML